jgi:hypothetical protein
VSNNADRSKSIREGQVGPQAPANHRGQPAPQAPPRQPFEGGQVAPQAPRPTPTPGRKGSI